MEASKLLDKHAKYFTGKSDETRIAITGIMHSLEGVAYVTDAQKVLRVEGLSEGKQGKVFSLTGRDLNVEPLNVERLLPDRDLLLVEDVRTKDLYDALNAFQAIAKVEPKEFVRCLLEATENALTLSFQLGETCDATRVIGSWRLDGKVITPFKKNFGPTLLFECVRVMKDWSPFVHLIGRDTSFTPLMLAAGEVETLALPIRIY